MADNYSIRDFATLLAKAFRSTESGGIHTPHHINAAGENHIGEISEARSLVEFTLDLDTSAYAGGDVLINTETLTDAMRITGGHGELVSVNLLDKDDQGVAMDLVFLRTNVSLGTRNSAPSIGDTDSNEILGFVPIETTDYVDVGGAKFATKRDVGLIVKAETGTKNLFMSAITRGGSPTYSASGLIIKLGFKLG